MIDICMKLNLFPKSDHFFSGDLSTVLFDLIFAVIFFEFLVLTLLAGEKLLVETCTSFGVLFLNFFFSSFSVDVEASVIVTLDL